MRYLLLLSVALMATDAPKIDPQMQADFWRSKAKMLEQALVMRDKDDDVKKTVEPLKAACGADHDIAEDKTGLICSPKPKTTEK